MLEIKLLWLSDLYDIKSPVMATLYAAYQLNFYGMSGIKEF